MKVKKSAVHSIDPRSQTTAQSEMSIKGKKLFGKNLNSSRHKIIYNVQNNMSSTVFDNKISLEKLASKIKAKKVVKKEMKQRTHEPI